ncbi:MULTISPECIES: hypothetical protein [unclassified Mycolicibacterium]|uniref:hypothetical protein n=1 Tax=unclassified Mycolicibacterium TaxID=2636767 RepID=UPI0012DF19C5|nr:MULTISPECIES: hypothetical protein [unclassified Mycolicibacterium]MUL82595.1 hypothetical protein [Mycolicibacterium sp. CBMA 329]MUL88930.1 hypothetical protein [Mycolicibacterium sp. CBMA 331]MUL97498.1 hypothetical protein [Mycolicibacterium sp. CBMA 334]MUM26777.1 hypothetical protein [Mycolicibacterium sp. CBMA 295]MUM38446.1 hypothetical protein [Mycolicibacterium sp. CBMA 247]
MDGRTRRAVTLMATGGVMLSGIGAAPAAASTFVPFSNQIRNCDFVAALFLGGMGSGSGSGWADISADGSDVRAQVRLQSARPDTDYQVRLVQLPRSAAATCNPGDPGVSGGVLHTDAGGTATITVSGPSIAGATAAWVVVEGPPAPGRIRGDVYSSDFLAKL